MNEDNDDSKITMNRTEDIINDLESQIQDYLISDRARSESISSQTKSPRSISKNRSNSRSQNQLGQSDVSMIIEKFKKLNSATIGSKSPTRDRTAKSPVRNRSRSRSNSMLRNQMDQSGPMSDRDEILPLDPSEVRKNYIGRLRKEPKSRMVRFTTNTPKNQSNNNRSNSRSRKKIRDRISRSPVRAKLKYQPKIRVAKSPRGRSNTKSINQSSRRQSRSPRATSKNRPISRSRNQSRKLITKSPKKYAKSTNLIVPMHKIENQMKKIFGEDFKISQSASFGLSYLIEEVLKDLIKLAATCIEKKVRSIINPIHILKGMRKHNDARTGMALIMTDSKIQDQIAKINTDLNAKTDLDKGEVINLDRERGSSRSTNQAKAKTQKRRPAIRGRARIAGIRGRSVSNQNKILGRSSNLNRVNKAKLVQNRPKSNKNTKKSVAVRPGIISRKYQGNIHRPTKANKSAKKTVKTKRGLVKKTIIQRYSPDEYFKEFDKMQNRVYKDDDELDEDYVPDMDDESLSDHYMSDKEYIELVEEENDLIDSD